MRQWIGLVQVRSYSGMLRTIETEAFLSLFAIILVFFGSFFVSFLFPFSGCFHISSSCHILSLCTNLWHFLHILKSNENDTKWQKEMFVAQNRSGRRITALRFPPLLLLMLPMLASPLRLTPFLSCTYFLRLQGQIRLSTQLIEGGGEGEGDGKRMDGC